LCAPAGKRTRRGSTTLQRESRPSSPRFVLGAFLLVMGVALILAQVGVLRVEDVTRFWPAALILLGLSMLQRRGGQRRVFGAFILIVVGAWLLLKTLGLVRLDPWEFLGPLILVAIGARIMLRHFDVPASIEGRPLSVDAAAPQSTQVIPPNGTATNASDHDELFAILSACHRRWSNTVFRSAAATSIMGGCELDLRQALMGADGSAHVEVFALMGGIKIFAPSHWTVVLQVTPVLGGVEDKSHTTSSISRQQLYVRGTVVMGGVEISN
jgi:hypothetical protein